MIDIIHKRILVVFWIVLLLSAVFLYFDLPYSSVTEPMLVPLLAMRMFIKDTHIARPRGKLVYFCGMFLAALGDALQIAINNEIFFISSLVAFMLMNLCYSIVFFSLQPRFYKKPWPALFTLALLVFLGYQLLRFLGGDRLGDYKIPLIVYMATLCMMVPLAMSLVMHRTYRRIAWTWLVPGAWIFVLQNLCLAINLFHLGSHSKLYVFSIVPYGIAQFFIMQGMDRLYNRRGVVNR